MSALLLYALHRAGRPTIASDLADIANGAAMDAGWPAQLCRQSPKQVAALLRGMERDGEVRAAGSVRCNGNDRSLWEPVGGFVAGVAMPDMPDRAEGRPDNPLLRMTRMQQLAVFSVTDTLLTELVQQRAELREAFDKHDARLRAVIERTRVQLSMVGLAE